MHIKHSCGYNSLSNVYREAMVAMASPKKNSAIVQIIILIVVLLLHTTRLYSRGNSRGWCHLLCDR